MVLIVQKYKEKDANLQRKSVNKASITFILQSGAFIL
jgi:hypothetical protein